MGKIRKLSELGGELSHFSGNRYGASPHLDSVEEAKRMMDDRARGTQVLFNARLHWDAMDKFRRDRERNKRYAYGDQWKDKIPVNGRMMTEEQYIKEQGNIPLKNNLIGRMIQAMLGVWRQQQKEPTCTARDRDEQKYGETMSVVLQCNMQLNRMTELNTFCMEEFLVSGLVVQRKWFGWWEGKLDCWTEYVQPNNFFIDVNMRDPRGWDASIVGELHDLGFNEVVEQFAKSPQGVARLGEIYGHAHERDMVTTVYNDFGYNLNSDWSFLIPQNKGLCRVIEVWRKENKPRYRCHDPNIGDVYKVEIGDLKELVLDENERRLSEAAQYGIPAEEVPLIRYEWFVDSYWYYYYLSPFGDILKEGETPYEHKSHPYVFKAYPFVDGEIHSAVSNVIDQQRYVNRLITMQDWIIRASAKGVLVFPEDCLPDGMSPDDIADEWTRYNGVIMIKQPKAGASMPQQISGNNTNIGISELLNIQMKSFEEISGVNGALQGRPGFSGMSASLYAQQTQNATTSLMNLMDVFSSFVREGAIKDVCNIQQFYDTARTFNIAGRKSTLIQYDPKKIRDVEFDLNIIESTSTPAYRMIANDMLMQLWQQQAIDVEMLLEHGDFPFADELLQSIQAKKAEMEQQQKDMAEQQQAMQAMQGGAPQMPPQPS